MGLFRKALLGTAVAVIASAGSAYAGPIAAGSVINFAGQSTCNSTTCTFGNTLVTSGTGSFSSFTFGNAATFFTLTYSPFTAQEVYTTTEAGLTTTFSVTSQMSTSTSVVGGLTNITVTDLGLATLTGFDATVGSFTFTANQSGTVQGSFSATTAVNAVPEPMSLALLGTGLLGAGVVRRITRKGGSV